MQAVVNIKGNIGADINENGESIESFTATDMAVFLSANQNATEIKVNIESGGGFVDEGFKIYEMLRSSGKKIITEATQCDSIASVIFLAGDVRIISKNSNPLIHFPFLQNFFLERATAGELEMVQKGIKEIENKIIKIYVERTGARKELLSTIMETNEPITSDMFKSLGFAHTVIDKVSITQYKAVAKAIFNNEINTNTMEKTEIKTWFEKLETMLKNLGTSKVKNLNVTLKDESVIYVKTENEFASVGDEGYSDEAYTTLVVDGEYELADGSKAMFVGGKIDMIETAKGGEDVEALKAEIEALKAEIEATKIAKNEAETKEAATVELIAQAKAKNEASIASVQKEFDAFKALVLDSSNEKPLIVERGVDASLEARRMARKLINK